MIRVFSRILTTAALTGGLATEITAQDSVPLDTDPPETASEAQEETLLEFRSVIAMGGESFFSLHDLATGASFWISEGNTQNDIEVAEFDADENVLTVFHGDELLRLSLSPSRIEEMAAENAGPTSRAERIARLREERRQRCEAFTAQWAEATATSPRLREIESQTRDLIQRYRATRSARRTAERGTEERDLLRRYERTAIEEIRLMAEYGALQATRTPAFAGHEADSMHRDLRRMMFRTTSSPGRN